MFKLWQMLKEMRHNDVLMTGQWCAFREGFPRRSCWNYRMRKRQFQKNKGFPGGGRGMCKGPGTETVCCERGPERRLQ